MALGANKYGAIGQEIILLGIILWDAWGRWKAGELFESIMVRRLKRDLLKHRRTE